MMNHWLGLLSGKRQNCTNNVNRLAIPSGMNKIPIAVDCRARGAATSANSNPKIELKKNTTISVYYAILLQGCV